jgi:methionine--tRNA ligase beta chain
MVAYDDFAKLELRVAKVLTAEKVENTEKLLKLGVDIGGEIRTIVAGIAKAYAPEELVGKKIIVLTNLDTRTIKGIQSQGMLLAAVDETDMPIVLTPEKDVKEGTKVS